MSYIPPNPNGQAASANSAPVVVASDQSAIPVTDGGGSLTVDATQSGTWTVQPGDTANTTPWLVTQTPATSGGLSVYRNLDVNATGVNIKSAAGQLYGYYLANQASSTRFVKFYNKATAPTVGTDTPIMTIPLPPLSSANLTFSSGVVFANGLGLGATTTIADNSTAAPSTNDVVANIFYK